MSINLKIGFNSNLITNSPYTKFLGLLKDCTLSWNNHIHLRMKKLSTACYIIRNVKIYISASVFKINYQACFHSAMRYEIIFRGNLSHSSTIFSIQKEAIRIMEVCGYRVSCRNLIKNLKILALTSQYLLHLVIFVVQNKTFSQRTFKITIQTLDKGIIYTCPKQT
jgi:hypothetical protein